MSQQDVTQTDPQKPARRISDPSLDKRVFTETAEKTHRENLQRKARPKRGGIRL